MILVVEFFVVVFSEKLGKIATATAPVSKLS
jgi:hypothetical protein